MLGLLAQEPSVIVYRLCFKFLVVHSAKHREYQLVAKPAMPCF